MIVIRYKNGQEFKYSGNLVINQAERFLIAQADFQNGIWTGHRYDGHFPEMIDCIFGVDDEITE